VYVLLHTYVAMFCCCGGGGRWCGRSCNDRKRRKRSLVNQLLQDADANRGADRPATWCRVRATRGLQKLHNRHLEDLLASAGGRGDRDNSSFWPSECMFGESTTADDRDEVKSDAEQALVLLSCLLRKPAEAGHQLMKIPSRCQSPSLRVGTNCVNPWHYCKIASTTPSSPTSKEDDFDSPPPPYSQFPTADSSEKPVTTLKELPSVGSTHANYAPLGSSTTWCKLAYWEECCRVGPLVTVTKPWVGVTSSPTPTSKKKHPGQAGSDHLSSPATNSKFSPKQSTASPKGDGEELSLNSLFSQNHNASESTRKLRDKIGKGIILQRIDDQVWLFNVSQIPIFVNSPTMDDESLEESHSPSSALPPEDSPPFTVHKVFPGHTVKAFDFSKSKQSTRKKRSPHHQGPFDPYAVRVSFGKGWGSKYSRQDATNCPSWLEILLVERNPPHPKMASSMGSDGEKNVSASGDEERAPMIDSRKGQSSYSCSSGDR